MMNNQDNLDKRVKNSELKRIEAETAKFEEEKLKTEIERKALEKNLAKPWYRKDKFYQAVTAGILAFPILWFFFDSVVRPLYNVENYTLKEQIAIQKDKLHTRIIEFEDYKDSVDQLIRSQWQVEAFEDSVSKHTLEIAENKYDALLVEYRNILAKIQNRDVDVNELNTKYNEIIEVQKAEKIFEITEFSIENALLKGKGTTFSESPNHGGEMNPDAVIIHSTSGPSALSAVNILMQPDQNASVHIIISRDGKVTQLVPFNVKAYHAGRSSYKGRSGYNSFSIGISLDNPGLLQKKGEMYTSWFGKEYKKDHVDMLPDESICWHKYTAIQIELTKEICQIITQHYSIKEILGHSDITDGRKLDPGPFFPVNDLREHILND